jgi:hypothetical protein
MQEFKEGRAYPSILLDRVWAGRDLSCAIARYEGGTMKTIAILLLGSLVLFLFQGCATTSHYAAPCDET